MGASKDRAIDNARAAFGELVSKVAAQTMVALDVSDDQVREDMAQNTKDAPMRAHLLAKLAVGMAKASVAETPVASNNLSITVIGSAENNAQWLALAAPFRRQISELKETIDGSVPTKSAGNPEIAVHSDAIRHPEDRKTNP